MQEPPYTLRRATVDDLDELKMLWSHSKLPVKDLERRVTEFQLVVDGEGRPVAAIGLRIEGKHGRIHSEAIALPEQVDSLRSQLWQRLQTVAKNHGLARLWIREPGGFWLQAGFAVANAESLRKLPAEFGDRSPGWLTTLGSVIS